MLNWDCTEFWAALNRGYGEGVDTREKAMEKTLAVIDRYENTPLTDFLMNVNAILSFYPSKTLENCLDKYNKEIENGKTVDFKSTSLRYAHEWYVRWEIDIFEVWIARLREIGVTPWISLRMNDAHHVQENYMDKSSQILSDWFYAHPEYRRVRHRPQRMQDGYYFYNTRDYAADAVRRQMLEYMEETLERYDVDGVELDWMREIFAFQIGGEYEGIEIINQFMRDVKAIVTRFEQKRGHKISIAVRLCASPETALYIGFDAATWAKEGLVDTIIPSPRFDTSDPDMPIELWQRLLAPYNASVVPCAELMCNERLISWEQAEKRINHTPETLAGLAAGYYAAGVEKLYLFNYLFVSETALHPFVENLRDAEHYIKFLKSASGMPMKRRHLIGFRDMLPFWEKPFIQLPRRCAGDEGYEPFRLRTGKAFPNASAVLILRITSEQPVCAKNIDAYLNSVSLDFLKTDGYFYEFSIPTDALAQVNTIEIGAVDCVFEVCHMEVQIQ